MVSQVAKGTDSRIHYRLNYLRMLGDEISCAVKTTCGPWTTENLSRSLFSSCVVKHSRNPITLQLAGQRVDRNACPYAVLLERGHHGRNSAGYDRNRLRVQIVLAEEVFHQLIGGRPRRRHSDGFSDEISNCTDLVEVLLAHHQHKTRIAIKERDHNQVFALRASANRVLIKSRA